MSRRLTATLLLALALVLTGLVTSSDAAAMPSKKQWVADTYKALYGSRAYVRDRVAKGGKRLALNLDIDNTSLETYYSPGQPVPGTLRLVKYAKSKGVYIMFNTGRNSKAHDATLRLLKRAGFPVDGLCMHAKGEALTHSKQRCRQYYVDHGYTLIANIGNRSTDFTGGNYERAFKLPNYNNRLG
jgi:predicted secreted acid phosphatase